MQRRKGGSQLIQLQWKIEQSQLQRAKNRISCKRKPWMRIYSQVSISLQCSNSTTSINRASECECTTFSSSARAYLHSTWKFKKADHCKARDRLMQSRFNSCARAEIYVAEKNIRGKEESDIWMARNKRWKEGSCCVAAVAAVDLNEEVSPFPATIHQFSLWFSNIKSR